VQVQEDAIEICGPDRLRRDDESLHAGNCRRLYRDAECLAQFWQRRDKFLCCFVDDILPLGGRLGFDSRNWTKRPGYQRLHLRADGVRHGERARRYLARARGCWLRYGLLESERRAAKLQRDTQRISIHCLQPPCGGA
jgi:hypothetical protein